MPRQISFVLSGIFAVLTLSGCGSKGSNDLPETQKEIDSVKSDYDKAIKSGENGNLYPGEFNRLFPGGQNVISYYRGGAGDRSWTAKAPLHHRYILQMTVPIELDSPGTTVISAGAPEFYLTEYTSISFRPDGAPIMQGQQLKSFSANEWRRLVAAQGDFTVLGITLKTNQPVEHFESAWRRVF